MKVGFEMISLRAVVMKIYIFWDITPYSPLKVNFQRTTRRYIPKNRSLHFE
jgi:hypothetical protein